MMVRKQKTVPGQELIMEDKESCVRGGNRKKGIREYEFLESSK